MMAGGPTISRVPSPKPGFPTSSVFAPVGVEAGSAWMGWLRSDIFCSLLSRATGPRTGFPTSAAFALVGVFRARGRGTCREKFFGSLPRGRRQNGREFRWAQETVSQPSVAALRLGFCSTLSVG
jgi:hypothetical protein